ncbi:MAG: hypothetical protein RLZZ444_579 [Pseudomonadota bacterium]
MRSAREFARLRMVGGWLLPQGQAAGSACRRDHQVRSEWLRNLEPRAREGRQLWCSRRCKVQISAVPERKFSRHIVVPLSGTAPLRGGISTNSAVIWVREAEGRDDHDGVNVADPAIAARSMSAQSGMPRCPLSRQLQGTDENDRPSKIGPMQSWSGARAGKLGFTPPHPLLSQPSLGNADGLFENFKIEDTFGAKMAKSLLRFTPCNQQAACLLIA